MRQTRRSPVAIRKHRVIATALVAAVGTVGAFIYNVLPSRSTSLAEPPPDEPSQSATATPSVKATPSVVPSPTHKATPKPSPTSALPTPTHSRPVVRPGTPPPTPHPVAQSKVESLIAFLESKVGHRYEWGATGPNAYDCSGLVQAAYAHIGIELPRTSEEQSLIGFPVHGNQALQPGDLLFWGAPGMAYHDAIYIGNGRYIAAENPERGIGIFTIDWWPPQYARRIL